jgi:hypothetical protein
MITVCGAPEQPISIFGHYRPTEKRQKFIVAADTLLYTALIYKILVVT